MKLDYAKYEYQDNESICIVVDGGDLGVIAMTNINSMGGSCDCCSPVPVDFGDTAEVIKIIDMADMRVIYER